MAKEYAIYPFEYMNISQRHDQGNHKPHWYGVTNHSDKPWDEACKDTGRSYFAPRNDFLIQQVKGLNTTKTTNSVRLKSVNKLYIPYKTEPDYLYLTLTHMNEDNLKQVKEGQILKKGTKILMEGTDGQATGNHFHITANIGKYYGLLQNNNGKWCWTYDKSLLPNEAFYLDKDYTTVKNARSYSFKSVPVDTCGQPVDRNESLNQIELKATNINARKTPNGTVIGYATKGIYNWRKSEKNGNYTWYEIEDGIWVAYSSTWATLYPKKEVIVEPEPEIEKPAEVPEVKPQEPETEVEKEPEVIPEEPKEETPEPEVIPEIPATPRFKVGDKVIIIGYGNGSSKGTSDIAFGLGWKRVILKVFEDDRPYPYKVGNEKQITGYYDEYSLIKID